MNRQALAFLTMFSLILMLSVYYVTLPSDATSVMSSETGEDLSDGEQDTSKEEVVVSDAQKLQEEIVTKNDQEVKKNSDIVSSTQASEEQKKIALQSIDTLKGDRALSEDITKALKEESYLAAIEILNGTCKVNVFEQEDTAENAQKIMNLVSEKCENKYLVEVTFK